MGETNLGSLLPVRAFLVNVPGGLSPSQFFGLFLGSAFAVTDIGGGFIDIELAGVATATVAGGSGQVNFSADADTVISTLQQQGAFAFNFNGALSVDRNATFPAPAGAPAGVIDPTAYTRVVANNTTGGHNIVIGTGVGSTITLGPGLSILVRFDGAGANEAVTAV